MQSREVSLLGTEQTREGWRAGLEGQLEETQLRVTGKGNIHDVSDLERYLTKAS